MSEAVMNSPQDGMAAVASLADGLCRGAGWQYHSLFFAFVSIVVLCNPHIYYKFDQLAIKIEKRLGGMKSIRLFDSEQNVHSYWGTLIMSIVFVGATCVMSLGYEVVFPASSAAFSFAQALTGAFVFIVVTNSVMFALTNLCGGMTMDGSGATKTGGAVAGVLFLLAIYGLTSACGNGY